MRCKNCGEEGHTAAGCPEPRKCHGCGATGHFFHDCPDLRRAYASAAAGGSASAGSAAGPGTGAAEQSRERAPEGGTAEATASTSGAASGVAAPEARPATEGDAENPEAELGDPDPDIADPVQGPAGRRQRGGGVSSTVSSSEGEGEMVFKQRKRRKKKATRGPEPGAVPGSAGSCFGAPSFGSGSGLPPSGSVATQNRFSALAEEGMEVAAGLDPGLDPGREAGNAAPVVGAISLQDFLGDSSVSEEHVFSPPSSPNDEAFLPARETASC